MQVFKWLMALALTVPLALLGWWLARDPGRLSIQVWGWQIHTTLVLALALIAAALLILWALYWLLWRLPLKLLARRQSKLVEQFYLGMHDFVDGNFARAKRRLSAASAVPRYAPLALLHAAKASGLLGEAEQALQLAGRAAKHASVREAAELFQIQFGLQQGDSAQLPALEQWAEDPQHSAQSRVSANALLARELSQRGRAREAMTLLARLSQQQKGSAARSYAQLSARDWAAMVRLALTQAPTRAALDEIWDALSAPERAQADVLSAYIDSAVRLGHGVEVESVLRAALRSDPCEVLWQSYASLWLVASATAASAARLDALKFVEKTLAASAPNESPGALLAAASLARAEQMSAKAKQYLARSLAMAPSAVALQLQGEFQFDEGDHLGAAQSWRKALAIV